MISSLDEHPARAGQATTVMRLLREHDETTVAAVAVVGNRPGAGQPIA